MKCLHWRLYLGQSGCLLMLEQILGFTLFFSRHFDHVVNFGPIPKVARRLGSLKASTIKTFQIGLSNAKGNFDLHIPRFEHAINTQLASLEDRGAETETIKIEVRTLDSFNYQDVDLLKIDVKGHESAVIQGAERTIQESRPDKMQACFAC